MVNDSVKLLEEELKNKVAADGFAAYDTTRIIEVDAKECFQSHFMSDLLAGKGGGHAGRVTLPMGMPCGGFAETTLPGFDGEMSHAENAEGNPDGGCRANALRSPRSPREIRISPAARAVLDAGRELWRSPSVSSTTCPGLPRRNEGTRG